MKSKNDPDNDPGARVAAPHSTVDRRPRPARTLRRDRLSRRRRPSARSWDLHWRRVRRSLWLAHGAHRYVDFGAHSFAVPAEAQVSGIGRRAESAHEDLRRLEPPTMAVDELPLQAIRICVALEDDFAGVVAAAIRLGSEMAPDTTFVV